jgi:parallel beta-helix repeat protein
VHRYLEGCDVSSETGSGVVGEGADLRVLRCKVHDCKTHGVAIYGDLLGEFGGGVVEGCEIVSNGQDGVLLRGGARGDVVNNVVADNGRFGVELVDCGEGSTVVGNTIASGGGKKTSIGFGGVGTEDAVTLSDNKLSLTLPSTADVNKMVSMVQDDVNKMTLY